MPLVKIQGKAVVNNAKLKIVKTEPPPPEFTIWNFPTPSTSTSITGFSVDYTDGIVSADWGTGYQPLTTDTSVTINL